MNISISICPTDLEFGCGDRHDADALLDAIREFIEERHPETRISCLQVGPRQGASRATINNDADAGERLLEDFFAKRGTDEDLFADAE